MSTISAVSLVKLRGMTENSLLVFVVFGLHHVEDARLHSLHILSLDAETSSASCISLCLLFSLECHLRVQTVIKLQRSARLLHSNTTPGSLHSFLLLFHEPVGCAFESFVLLQVTRASLRMLEVKESAAEVRLGAEARRYLELYNCQK